MRSFLSNFPYGHNRIIEARLLDLKTRPTSNQTSDLKSSDPRRTVTSRVSGEDRYGISVPCRTKAKEQQKSNPKKSYSIVYRISSETLIALQTTKKPPPFVSGYKCQTEVNGSYSH